MIDRAPLQPRSWQISGQCMRGGAFRMASGWLLKARPLPKTNKRAWGAQACRASIGRPPWGLRDGRNSSKRQVAAIDYVWIIWDFAQQPLLTLLSPSRKEKYSTKWKNRTTKRKIVDRIPLRLETPKPLFLWFVLDIGWQHVGVRSVQS